MKRKNLLQAYSCVLLLWMNGFPVASYYLTSNSRAHVKGAPSWS